MARAASGRGALLTAALVAVQLVLWPGSASALPASGPHETVDLWSSTTQPNASASLGYAARYHRAHDPEGDPPALRYLKIELPPGTRIDTSVPDRCTASDDEIMSRGESACPPSARIGVGEVTVKQFGAATATYPTVLYNAPDDMLELVKSGDRVVGVVHTYVRGTTLEGPIPTCIGGGQPPDGCPFDQLTLLANHLQVNPISVGPRNYGTTPPTCPASGRWQARVTLTYADGSVDTVTPEAPCDRPPSLRIGHPGVTVDRRGTVVELRCAGPAGARCGGTLTLEPTGYDTRLGRAGGPASALRFAVASGAKKRVRIQVPPQSRARLERRGKAVVRAVARLDDGRTVRRLLSLYGG